MSPSASQSALSASHRDLLVEGIGCLGLHLESTQVDQLFGYGQLIEKWNRTFNLTSIRNPNELITHHLLDSLAVLPVFDREVGVEEPVLLDVGAGAGLPGIVLAIARPAWKVCLVDTVQKKATFMQQVVAELGLIQVKPLHARVEDLVADQMPFGEASVVCSRAFSSLDLFVDLSQHVLKKGGCFLALKGRKDKESFARIDWQVDYLEPIEVPFLEEERHVVCIRDKIQSSSKNASFE